MKTYNQVDQQLHVLCQTLAKANRTFVSPKEDDSHTNLYFDSLTNQITGRWFELNGQRQLFVLNLEKLQFEMLNSSHEVLQPFPCEGVEITSIENEISQYLSQAGGGMDGGGFTGKLHYEIPEYEFARLPVTAIDSNALAMWIEFRTLANTACQLFLGHTHVQGEIRIWPHHFDTGTYVEVNEKIGIGFGMAMEDQMAGAPYFYMAGYPKSGTISYDNLPKSSEWKWELGEYWKGAVLPIDQFSNKSSFERMQSLNTFMKETFTWFVRQ